MTGKGRGMHLHYAGRLALQLAAAGGLRKPRAPPAACSCAPARPLSSTATLLLSSPPTTALLPRSTNKYCIWAKESPKGMTICMSDSRDKLHYVAYAEVSL